MDLVTIGRIKELVGMSVSDTANDSVLEWLISAVSADAESEMNRYVQNTTQTEYFDAEAGDTCVMLSGMPVSSITSVHNDTEWVYGSTTLVDSDYYKVHAETGILYFSPNWSPFDGPQALKVVYTGGMATDVTAFMASYPDIAHAVARQVMYLFNTRNSIGAEMVSIGETSVSWHGDVDWLPGVKEVLRKHRRGPV